MRKKNSNKRSVEEIISDILGISSLLFLPDRNKRYIPESLKGMNRRHLTALLNPIDKYRSDGQGQLQAEHHQYIPPYSTLLTVDFYQRDYETVSGTPLEIIRPEWHFSVAVRFEDNVNPAILKSFDMWDDAIKARAIQSSLNWMNGRGDISVNNWLGRPASLHLFRPLTDDEVQLLPYRPKNFPY